MKHSLSFISLIKRVWSLLESAPGTGIKMSYELNVEDFSIKKSLIHHLEVLLYRYGHKILRGTENGSFQLSIYDNSKPFHKQSINPIFKLKRELYLIIEFSFAIKPAGIVKTRSTEFPERLISLHLNALNGRLYQTKDKTICMIPRSIFD